MFMRPEYHQGSWIEIDTSQGIINLPVSVVGRPTNWNGNALQPGDCEGITFDQAMEFYSDYINVGIADVYSFDEITTMRNTQRESGQPVGVRLSAPGYLDCTEWTTFATMKEARDYIAAVYDVDPDSGDPLSESLEVVV